MAVKRKVVGYELRLTIKLKASPAGGAQMNSTVTPRWTANAAMGVLKGRFCIIRLGKGVMPSFASSWRTRAIWGIY
jgi:hypothetical protein